MLAEYDAKNPPALRRLLRQGVQLRSFPQDVMKAALKNAFELYEEEAAKNPAFARIYGQWRAFREEQYQWFSVAELTYANFAFQQKP